MTSPDTIPGALHAPAEAALRQFEPLSRAERILLRACVAGDIARVGFQRPELPSAAVRLRGSLIAFLARGGGEGFRFRPRRIQLLGAWIEGRVDLGDADRVASLWFYRCVFDQVPLLDGTRIAGSLAFPDCRLPGLMAERCRIGGELLMNAGCEVVGEVRLARATIEGDLKLERLHLPAAGDGGGARRPWIADLARVQGSVLIGGGFESSGEVRFVGARVEGDFVAAVARLTGGVDASGARRAALNLDRISVGGDLRFGPGFAAAGTVRLRRAQVEGDLDASGAGFDIVGDSAWGEASALALEHAFVRGALILQRLKAPLLGVSLEGARAGALIDDESTWGERLVLDGFEYRRLGDGAPTDADFRLAWLERQLPAHLGDDYRPTPWRHLIGVLRHMGRESSARALAKARERHLRRIGRVGRDLPWLLRPFAGLGHRLFGALAGYGHAPWRLAVWLFALWIGCAAAYWAAAGEGLITSTAPRIAAGPAFNPWVYSLDVMLPAIDLAQQRSFGPVGPASLPSCTEALRQPSCLRAATELLGWFEAVAGWLALALALALVAGTFDRDRREASPVR